MAVNESGEQPSGIPFLACLYMVAYLLILPVGIIAIGIATGSVWIGLGCIAAAVLVHIGANRGSFGHYGQYWLITGAGILTILALGVNTAFAGQWLWAIPFAGFAMTCSGVERRMTNQVGQRTLGFLYTIICGGLAVIVPFYGDSLVNLLGTSGLAATALGSIPVFYRAIGSTFWGIVYIVVILLLASIWIKGWLGVWLAAWLLTLGVWSVAGQGSEALALLITRFTSSPIALWGEALHASNSALGSAAYAPLIAGVAMTLLFYAPLRESVKTQIAMAKTAGLQEALGTTIAMAQLQRRDISTLRYLISGLLLGAIGIGLTIAWWMALREMPMSGANLGFSPTILPDITVPNFAPVWQLSYVALAALAAILSVYVSSVQSKHHLNLVQATGCAMVVSFFIVAAAALFIPAGVLLWAISLIMSQTMAIQIIAGQTNREIEGDVISIIGSVIAGGRDSGGAAPPKPRPVEPGGAAVQKPASSQLSGTTLFTHFGPIIDMAISDTDTFYVLDSDSRLCRWTKGKLHDTTKLDVAEPLGVALVSGNKVVITDRGGQIVTVVYPAKGQSEIDQHMTATPIACFAVNPFGTMLAFADSSGKATALFLATGKEQTLGENLDGPTALAFSGDGRTLAVGCVDGQVRLLDVASRQVSNTLPIIAKAGGVVGLAARPRDEEWVVLYQNNVLASWNVTGAQTHKPVLLPVKPFCLAVESVSGAAGVGFEDGTMSIYPSNMGEPIFNAQVHLAEVTRIVYQQNGRAVVSASHDGSVRRNRF